MMRKLFYLCLLGVLLLSGTVGLASYNPWVLYINQSVTEGYAPLTVVFGARLVNAESNSEPLVLSIRWDFGDGTSSSGNLKVSHEYPNPGIYIVNCTCTLSGRYSALSSNAKVIVLAPPASSNYLTFTSNPGGNCDIYTIKEDGSNLTRLTTNWDSDCCSSWSPDGTKIVFESIRNVQNTDIYVIPNDGSIQTRLTTDLGRDSEPTWSPDGSKIVFVSNRDGRTRSEIYVMNADGSNQVRLTGNPSYYFCSSPSWSPDGSKITFQKGLNGNEHIYVMNADGSNIIQLTNYSYPDRYPSWSPDGTEIAFSRSVDGVNWNIFVMNADGSNPVCLTNDVSIDLGPCWSPDGTKIAFSRNGEIYIMNADGSNQTGITPGSCPCFKGKPR